MVAPAATNYQLQMLWEKIRFHETHTQKPDGSKVQLAKSGQHDQKTTSWGRGNI